MTALRIYRTRRRLSQYQLGLLIGLTPTRARQTIWEYEAGVRFPRARRLLKIARVLGVRPEKLTPNL